MPAKKPMSPASSPDDERTERELRATLDRLRRERFAEPPPPPDRIAALDAEIAAAGEALEKVVATRRAKAVERGEGLLVSSAAGTAGLASGGLMGPDTTGLEVQVFQRMSSVPTGIAHILDHRDAKLVSFRVKNVGNDTVRIRLRSRVEGYSAEVVQTVEIPPGETAERDHLPTFFPDRLRPVTEVTRATLHVEIDDLDKKTEQEATFPITLLARTSAYLGVDDPKTGKWVDLTRYLAAWVTPNAPEVLAVLREAAGLHPEGRIVGYQVDAAGVAKQVQAIFNALKAHGIVYVNSTFSFGKGLGEFMQRVRSPRESLATRSANCIDGTVLVASLLEAASLDPAIVIVPGHAFVAWEKQRATDDWDYLETTKIATHDFDAAVASARAREAAEKVTLVSVAAERAAGITPME